MINAIINYFFPKPDRAELIKFLRKKPDLAYDPCSATECAIAFYLKSIKYKKYILSPKQLDDMFGPNTWYDISEYPRTYGALANRLDIPRNVRYPSIITESNGFYNKQEN